MNLVITRLPEGAWQQLRDLRLEALRESPSAFWATWEDESRYDAAEWTRFATAVVWFVAARGERHVGMVGVLQHEDRPGEPEIIGMWVHPAERRRGAGGLLLDAVLGWAERHQVPALTLWVTEGNEAARELYRRHGFVLTGEEAPLPGGRRGTEARMRRSLAAPSMLSGVPGHLRDLAEAALDRAREDPRVLGLVVAGSVANGTADDYSDLDLVIVCDDESHQQVLASAHSFAEQLGPLLVAFTGEHVGEPRLLIALYDSGPTPASGPRHVDLKFVSVSALDSRVEDGAVVWQRDRAVDCAYERREAVWPAPPPQWIEDRFWTWVHYTTVKIARGELFEAVNALNYMRTTALGPLAVAGRSTKVAGVRRLEQAAPELVPAFRDTVADATVPDCLRATEAVVDLYLALRDPAVLEQRTAAERAARDYLASTARRLGASRGGVDRPGV